MEARSAAYIRGFASRLGRIRSIDELDLRAVDRERLERLGLRQFAQHEGDSLVDLMCESAADSLERSGLASATVDRVLFATSDFVQEKNRDDLARVATVLGLVDALPLGISQGFCTNFSLAFEVAECLLAGGRARTILLITADRYRTGLGRVLRGNAGLGSDGAASCVITREFGAGYALSSVAHTYAPYAAELRGPGEAVEYVRVYAEGYARACELALAAAARCPGDCARLVVPNFSASVLRNLSELAGIPMDRTHRGNAERFGHCNSADQLIALSELEEELTEGDRVLVTGAGEYLWGAVLLTKVRGKHGTASPT